MWELPKFVQKHDKIQFFLVYLLVLLANRPCFCLGGPVGLTVGLAIGDAMSISGEVTVGLLG